MKFIHTADTHIGFEFTRKTKGDHQGRLRVAKAVLDNFVSIVETANEMEVDVFIHSGDLFNKFYIPQYVLHELIRPFLQLSGRDIPLLIIAGNHEKAAFPYDLFHGMKKVYVFDEPKSILLTMKGLSICFAGFPFIRNESSRTFLHAVKATEYESLRADFNILITHQAFDQATVGPADFVFRQGRPDTAPRYTVPTDFSYIAAGHIHRHQVLPHPLTPGCNFVYPGSSQRISFAERDEEKGFIVGEILNDRIETSFIRLPVFNMEIMDIEISGLDGRACEETIRSHFWRFYENLVIRFNLTGIGETRHLPEIDFQKLRAEMPPVLDCQFAVKTGPRRVIFF